MLRTGFITHPGTHPGTSVVIGCQGGNSSCSPGFYVRTASDPEALSRPTSVPRDATKRRLWNFGKAESVPLFLHELPRIILG